MNKYQILIILIASIFASTSISTSQSCRACIDSGLNVCGNSTSVTNYTVGTTCCTFAEISSGTCKFQTCTNSTNSKDMLAYRLCAIPPTVVVAGNPCGSYIPINYTNTTKLTLPIISPNDVCAMYIDSKNTSLISDINITTLNGSPLDYNATAARINLD